MYYVYNGRFQPFSLLNEAELDWLVENTNAEDKIIVGIVNPTPTFIDASENADSWVRFKLEYNPLSYWERYEQIKAYIDKKGIADKVCAITPLPRPSKNMVAAMNYLPPKDKRVICLPIVHDSELEEEKREGLVRQGEDPMIIPSETFGAALTIISPELIFCLMAINNDGWENLVSTEVREHLISLNVERRLPERGLSREKAIATLRKIYKRTSNSMEALLLYNILYRDITDIDRPKEKTEAIRERTQRVEQLRRIIHNLLDEIETEITALRRDAPNQYRIFSESLVLLYRYDLMLEGTPSDEQLDKISLDVEDIKEKWELRNR